MQNAILLLGIGMFGTLSITIFARFGKAWLYSAIVVHLILISVMGGKLISIFGFTTNIGNVFYMNVTFAIYLLIERFGRRAAYQSIWIGLGFTLLFVIETQLALIISGTDISRALNQHLEEILKIVPRLAFASLFAFVISQTLSIWMYDALGRRTDGKRLWFRHIISISASQFLDSTLFFSIAFLQVLPPTGLLQVILAGYLVKLAHGVLMTPFLYFSRIGGEEDRLKYKLAAIAGNLLAPLSSM